MPKISPKLTAAIAPPLTAVVTAMILTGDVDRTSLAALAAIVIAAALGYHAPSGATKPLVTQSFTTGNPGFTFSAGPMSAAQPIMAGTMGPSGPGMTDDGDDGDDQLPAELEQHPVDSPPADEIDQPDATVPA
jgi:hypothetical protein